MRHRVEAANKAVALLAEYDVVKTLAASQGESTPDALANLKLQGLWGVVIAEQSVNELISDRKVDIVPGARNGMNSVPYQGGELIFLDGGDRLRVEEAVKARFGDIIPPLDLLRSTSIGLDPEATGEARKAGLKVTARMGNPQGASAEYIETMIARVKEAGAELFLPQGDQVLGRRNNLKALVDSLERHKVLYATAEFAKIGGDSNVVNMAPQIVVRLHTAQAGEIDRLPLADAVDRFAKAARERNMRALLLRPVSNSVEKPRGAFGDFIREVNDQIRKEGGNMGSPKPFTDPDVPRILFLAIALSTIPAAYFASRMLPLKLGQKLRPADFAWGLYAGAMLLAWVPSGRGYVALFASLLFPIVAYRLLDLLRPKPFAGYWLVSAVSLIGGLCVAGLLNGLPFLVKADEFSGIKISVFLPIILIGLYFMSRLAGLKESMGSAITYGSAALGLVLVVALAFMLSRTGNDNPAGVSGVELAFRNLLDNVLFVRPRTKEFLIGNPALYVACGMLISPRSKQKGFGGWTALALMIGSIGSTSIVNTMCHLHTPVILGLSRIGIGLVLGCILGAGVWAAAKKQLA